MNPSQPNSKRQQLELAIAAQESLRGTVDDTVIDATIATLNEKLAALTSAPQQRKLATILFMDIAGHTALTVGLDPEEQMAVVDPAIARLAAMVDKHGGHVTRYQGDGFKAVFGLPVAHENDPEQAVRAGLAIQQEAALIAAELEERHGLAGFAVRVGITTGMVFSGGETEGQDTIKGSPVNLASRLESAAEPGAVLISRDTFNLVRGFFDAQSLEPVLAKGFAKPVQVFRVLRAKPQSFYQRMSGIEGVESPMIGREGEFKQLKDAFQRARLGGQAQVITLVGEAGLGKSRLLLEFENWTSFQPAGNQLLLSRAGQDAQSTPYGLLRNLLAYHLDIQDDDSPQIAAQKLRAGLADSLPEGDDLMMKADFIGYLVGYNLGYSSYLTSVQHEPQQLRNQAVKYLEEYFKILAQTDLVILLLEDIHWADDSSLDVINQLVLRLRNQALLVVAATRPSLFAKGARWGEDQAFHARVDLPPLSKLDSQRLVSQILKKVNEIPKKLRNLVVANAEGNPFYLEELVKMLIEQGAIIPGEERWRIAGFKLDQIRVPQTLTGVLQARLDRLDQEERSLLQQASAVGRTFWDLLLVALHKAEDGQERREYVLNLLEALRGREIIYRRETSAYGEAVEYSFKHDLLREVTYESILLVKRREYHSLAADWLIENSKIHGVRNTSLVAGHLVNSDRPEEAFVYLQQAGEEAAAAYALEEAISFFTQAMELALELELSAETLTNLYTGLGRAFELNSQFDRALETYREMMQVAQQHSDPRMKMKALIAQATIQTVPSSVRDLVRAEIVGEEALFLARELGDQAAESKTLWCLSLASFWQGRLSNAIKWGETSLSLARQLKLPRQVAQTLNDLGSQIYIYSGNINDAIRCLREASSIWRELGNKPMLADNLASSSVAHVYAGEYDLAVAVSKEALQISESIDNVWGKSYSRWKVGYAYWDRGEVSKGIRLMEDCIRLGKQAGFTPSQDHTGADLAAIYGELGDTDRAFQAARTALKAAEDHNPVDRAHVLGILARLHLLKGETMEALALIEEGKVDPFRDSWSLFYLQIPLVEIEWLLHQEDFTAAAKSASKLAMRIEKDGIRIYLARVLYLQAQAYLGIGEKGKAADALNSAQSKALAIGSKQIQWRTLYALSHLEKDPRIARSYIEQAQEILDFIIRHIPYKGMRAGFKNRADVKEILDSKINS